MTVSDVLYAGYRIAGILGSQRGMSPSDTADGLLVLNSMVDAWAAVRTLVYAIDRTEFSLVPNVGTYTIGQGADFSLAQRPVLIERASIVYVGANPQPESGLAVLLNEQEWQAVSPKNLKATIPSLVYYKPTVPSGTLYFWATPTVANKVAIYSWITVNQFAAITDTVVLPQAYQEAIEYNLAVRLAARYPDRQRLSPLALMIAKSALRRIKVVNGPTYLMQTESAVRGVNGGSGHFNILTNHNQ